MATLLIHPEDLDSDGVLFAVTEETLASIHEAASKGYPLGSILQDLKQDNIESIPLNES